MHCGVYDRRRSHGYQYTEIYAQWGESKSGLEWLEKAMRLRDTEMANLRTDPLMDPQRKEPRLQAIERQHNPRHSLIVEKSIQWQLCGNHNA
jgi:hypothetical protein